MLSQVGFISRIFSHKSLVLSVVRKDRLEGMMLLMVKGDFMIRILVFLGTEVILESSETW